MVAVSAYMGDTRGSGVLSSAGDVFEMNVVRGVGGVCDMCMCLARGGVGGEWVRGLSLGFTNPGGTRGKWDMRLCFGNIPSAFQWSLLMTHTLIRSWLLDW